MINNVVLVGRLTRDPDLRYIANGTAVATFNLAVNRSFTNQAGEREADFIQCVIWRKPAETLANYARKGTLIGVEGRIQTRNYDNQEGQRVYVTEVICENFQLLESKEVNNARIKEGQQPSNEPKSSDRNDFSPQDNFDPFADSQTIDISDDDLPF